MKAKRYLSLFIFAFLIHGGAITFFRIAFGPAGGINADASAMVWAFWIIVDLPLSLVLYLAPSLMDGDITSLVAFTIVGGAQWGVWIILACWVRDRFKGASTS